MLVDKFSADTAVLILNLSRRKTYLQAFWHRKRTTTGIGRARKLWLPYNVDGDEPELDSSNSKFQERGIYTAKAKIQHPAQQASWKRLLTQR